MKQAAKHRPGEWTTDGGPHVQTIYTPTDGGKPFYHTVARTDQPLVSSEQQAANSKLIAAAPDLLAYSECSAAWDCSLLDPRFDPQPILRSHGWNEQENPGVFLSRIRRDALNKAVGHYLGRLAA